MLDISPLVYLVLTGLLSTSLSAFSLCLKVGTLQCPVPSSMLYSAFQSVAAVCLACEYLRTTFSLSLFLSSRPLTEMPPCIYEGISCSTNESFHSLFSSSVLMQSSHHYPAIVKNPGVIFFLHLLCLFSKSYSSDAANVALPVASLLILLVQINFWILSWLLQSPFTRSFFL